MSDQLALFGMGNDARPLPEIIASGGSGWSEFPLQYHDVDGSRYYAVQDWIAGVSGSDTPRQVWTDIKARYKDGKVRTVKNGRKPISPEKAEHVQEQLLLLLRQLKYHASNGKNYTMDFADAEGLYLIMDIVVSRLHVSMSGSIIEIDLSGYVYVLHFEQFPNEYKIGMTTDLEKRMRVYCTENPPSISMIVDCTFYYADCRAVEKELHAALKEYRLRGEWFNLTADQIPTIKQWLAGKNTDLLTGRSALKAGVR